MGLLDDLFRGPGLLNAGPGHLNGAAHSPTGTPEQPAPFGWAPTTADSMIQQARKQLSEQNAPPEDSWQTREALENAAAAGINPTVFSPSKILGRYFPTAEAGGADFP